MFFKNKIKKLARKKISEYFDRKYYLEANKDVRENGSDPLEHYFIAGHEEDRAPNRWFSPEFYRASNPDLKDEKDLFLHYLLHGWKEKRLPNPFTDDSLYAEAETLEDIKAYFTEEKIASLKEISRKKDKAAEQKSDKKAQKPLTRKEVENIILRKYFDPEYYLDANKDVKENGADPLEHYIVAGHKEERAPNRWFSPEFYRESNPDLKDEPDLFLHYLLHGWKEKRLPNPFADHSLYEEAETLDDINAYFTEEKIAVLKELSRKRDEAAKQKSDEKVKKPLDQKEVRNNMIKKYFDPEYYLEINKDVKEKGIDPLQHYLEMGGKEENRIPNRWFAPGFYLERNPGLKKSKIDPFLHYLLHGWKEKRLPNPFVDPSFYEEVETLDDMNAYFTEARMNALRDRKENEMGYVSSVYTLDGKIYIKGWAITGCDIKAAVEIFLNGVLYTTVFADEYQEGLEKNGVGDGKYGFTVPLPKNLLTKQNTVIEVRSKFTGKDLINSPQLYSKQ